MAMQGDEITNRVDGIETNVEEMTEKIYELDKSWKNNLVFYGVKCDDGEHRFLFLPTKPPLSFFPKSHQGTDEHPSVTESKIRDVIRKTMRIHRDISILRVKRAFNGPNIRGCKPITVYFDKWEVR